MSRDARPTIPAWARALVAIGLLWYLMGCVVFGLEMLAPEAAMASMSDPEKELARSIPGWVHFVHGVAVSAGLSGSIGFLLRKRWATRAFAICLGAVLVQMAYTMLVAGGLAVMGASGAAVAVVVIGIAGALLWLSRVAAHRGWLAPT